MVTHTLSVKILGQSSVRNIHVDRSSRFKQLKELIVENLLKSGTIVKQDVVFYAIYVILSSFTHDDRIKIIPNDQDYIVEYLDRIANIKLGSCHICFDDMRIFKDDAQPKPSPLPINNSGADVQSGVVWINKSSNITYAFPGHMIVNWTDSLFWDISSCALMQGRVQRKIFIGRRQDQWREYWAILTQMKLWMFPLSSFEREEQDDCLSPPLVLELGVEPCVVDLQDQVTLSFSYREFISDDSEVSKHILMSKYTKKRETLRVKTALEANAWIRALNELTSEQHENSIFHNLEETIAQENQVKAQVEFDKLSSYQSLIHFLKQSSLRNPFKTYLESIRKLDILKFWEYAEDFRSNFDRDRKSGHLSPSHKSQLPLWIDKIRKLQVEMAQCAAVAVCCDVDESNPEADMFYKAQQIAWTHLLKLFHDYSQTSEFNRIILQMLNEKATTGTAGQTPVVPQLAPNRSSGGIRPISSVIGWIAGHSSKSAAKGGSNDSKNNRTPSNESTFVPLWRQTSIAFSIPDWWWDRLDILELAEWSDKERDSTHDIEHLNNFPVVQVPVNECPKPTDLLTGISASLLKGTGKVFLMSTFRCTLQFNSQTSKFRPLSLFGFGGGEDAYKSQSLDTSYSVRALNPDDDDFASMSYSKKMDNIVAEALGDYDPPARTNSMANNIVPEDIFQSLTTNGLRQVVVFCENLDQRMLYFLDPTSFSYNFCIRVDDLVLIGPAHKHLYGVEMVSTLHGGFSILLHGDQNDDVDKRTQSTQWLNTLSMLCPSTVTSVNIIKRGYLQKRGRVNTAFKWRWFELSSDLQLRYYKDDVSGAFKGSIDLSLLDPTDDSSFVSYVDKELVINMHKIKRVWVLKSEDEKVGGEWVFLINDLINYAAKGNQSMRYLNTHTELDEEDDD